MFRHPTTRQALRAIVTMHDLNKLYRTHYGREEAAETARLIVRIVHRPLEWSAVAMPVTTAENIKQDMKTLAHPLPHDAQKQIVVEVQRVQMAVSMREPSAKALDDLIECVRYYTTEEGDL